MTVMEITGRLGGPQVLDQEIRSDLDFVEMLRDGLPTAAVDAIVMGGTLTSQEVENLVIPRPTLAHRRQKKQRLSPEESDRLARIARISALADKTFQNAEKAARWLRKPNRALGGAVPLGLLSTGEGARLVEETLGQIAHGIFA